MYLEWRIDLTWGQQFRVMRESKDPIGLRPDLSHCPLRVRSADVLSASARASLVRNRLNARVTESGSELESRRTPPSVEINF